MTNPETLKEYAAKCLLFYTANVTEVDAGKMCMSEGLLTAARASIMCENWDYARNLLAYPQGHRSSKNNELINLLVTTVHKKEEPAEQITLKKQTTAVESST